MYITWESLLLIFIKAYHKLQSINTYNTLHLLFWGYRKKNIILIGLTRLTHIIPKPKMLKSYCAYSNIFYCPRFESILEKKWKNIFLIQNKLIKMKKINELKI